MKPSRENDNTSSPRIFISTRKYGLIELIQHNLLNASNVLSTTPFTIFIIFEKNPTHSYLGKEESLMPPDPKECVDIRRNLITIFRVYKGNFLRYNINPTQSYPHRNNASFSNKKMYSQK